MEVQGNTCINQHPTESVSGIVGLQIRGEFFGGGRVRCFVFSCVDHEIDNYRLCTYIWLLGGLTHTPGY